MDRINALDWINQTTLLLLATLIPLLIYFVMKRKEHHDWWMQQNVPFIEGKLFKLRKSEPLQIVEQKSYNTYGRIYGRFDGALPVLTIGDAEILEKVLYKDFDVFQTRRDMQYHDSIMDNTLFSLKNPDWKRVRSVVSRAFTSQCQRTMLPILENSAEYLIENLKKSNESGKINCQVEFEKAVLHAIGTCAFGLEMTALEDPENDFVKYSRKLFSDQGRFKSYFRTEWPWLMDMLGLFKIKLLNPEATEFFKGVVIDAIEERIKSDVERIDFLQTLIKMAKIENPNEGNKLDYNNNEDFDTCLSEVEDKANSDSNQTKPAIYETPKKNKFELSYDEMVSQCATFFLAGSDSTISLLCNVFYHLTKNKECQERVYNEIINEKNPSVNLFDALNNMKYLDAVIMESLRMVPAMVRLERSCHQDYVVEHEGQKIHLKKGMLVNIPAFAMHYDEKYYPEPTTFKPERFLKSGDNKDQNKYHSKYTFLGFGEGHRKCVASKFVPMWAKSQLVRILEEFELEECDSTAESLQMTEKLGLLKIGPVEVRLRKRSTA